ncbi:MAG: hypothetical protein ACLFWF_13915 [Alphaproteobacteria bacterium]
MATANVSNGPNRGGKAAAGKPHPQPSAPEKPQTKPGRKKGKEGRGKKK